MYINRTKGGYTLFADFVFLKFTILYCILADISNKQGHQVSTQDYEKNTGVKAG